MKPSDRLRKTGINPHRLTCSRVKVWKKRRSRRGFPDCERFPLCIEVGCAHMENAEEDAIAVLCPSLVRFFMCGVYGTGRLLINSAIPEYHHPSITSRTLLTSSAPPPCASAMLPGSACMRRVRCPRDPELFSGSPAFQRRRLNGRAPCRLKPWCRSWALVRGETSRQKHHWASFRRTCWHPCSHVLEIRIVKVSERDAQPPHRL